MATGTQGTDAVVGWLVSEGLVTSDTDSLIRGLVPRMEALGLRVVRLWHTWQHRHPLLESRDWIWSGGELEHRTIPAGYFEQFVGADPRTIGPAGELADRPMWHARAADGPADHELVNAQFDAGATDYVALSAGATGGVGKLLDEGKGPHGFGICTWALDVEGGLDADGLSSLRRIHDAFCLASLLQMERGHARTLVHTFLGRDTGTRVLEGRTRRGDKLEITAAIAFTDLRGFSALAEAHDTDVLLDLLDDAFEAQVEAIEAHGGHVLSFLGDGILAIWPDDAAGRATSCDRALSAARSIAEAVGAKNAERTSADKPPIRYGIALHWGEVVYGNIGAPHRLSFTVLGPAVNRTARLESLGAKLGLKPILSRAFADRTSAACVSRGTHPAKGVGELEVWTLAEPCH